MLNFSYLVIESNLDNYIFLARHCITLHDRQSNDSINSDDCICWDLN